MEVCKVMLLFSCQSSTALCDDHSGPSQVTLVVKKPSANARDRKCGFRSLGQEDPLQEGMAIHSSTLAWNPMDRGAWCAAVHGVAGSGTTEAT